LRATSAIGSLPGRHADLARPEYQTPDSGPPQREPIGRSVRWACRLKVQERERDRADDPAWHWFTASLTGTVHNPT